MKVSNRMEVGRLKSILAKYDDNLIIHVYGGEDENGSFAYLRIAEDKDDYIWQCGDIIMEYEDQKGEWKMLTIEEILSILTDNGEEEITMEDYGDFFIISVGGDEDQVLVFFCS